MILCHCKGVTDRTIRETVRDGARSCRQVARSCQAGASCGGCHSAIHQIIEEESYPAASFRVLSELQATG